MPDSRLGHQSIAFPHSPAILAAACVSGPKEGRGPVGGQIDMVAEDALYHQESYEKAEHALFLAACNRCLEKAGMQKENIRAMLGGDLLNQIMASSLSARDLAIPFLGLYGACSTMAESLLLGAVLADGGYADPVLCAAGSHYATAERQYRFPLEYGNQRTPAAQWTVTGAGACMVGVGKGMARITHGTLGRVTDMGIKDANNMGAVMAPAAADTLLFHFQDTGRSPADYDQIITGDLGLVGSRLLYELMTEKGIPLPEGKHMDCGLSIFDPKDDTHAGGSGCGCSAILLCAHILPKIMRGEWKRVLFMATGALLSTTTAQQGETIPGVAHALVLEGGK